MHLNFAPQLELGNAPEVFTQDFLFDLELVIVAGVLVVASAAACIVRACGLDSVWRGFHDCSGVCAGESGLFLGKRGFDFLSAKNERNEYGLAASVVFITRRLGGEAS